VLLLFVDDDALDETLTVEEVAGIIVFAFIDDDELLLMATVDIDVSFVVGDCPTGRNATR